MSEGPLFAALNTPSQDFLQKRYPNMTLPDLRHLAEGAGEDLETGDDVGNHGESI